MSLIFPEPRHNPEYKFSEVMTDYNFNFSSVTSSITALYDAIAAISGTTTTFSGGTIASSTNVLGNLTANSLYISSTSIMDIFIANDDVINGGTW
jgi:hypothetical protein